MLNRKNQKAVEFRSATVSRDGVDTEARTVELAFSSEEPYQRWWGTEILDHSAASVRLGRLSGGRHPLLVDHNTGDQVGVVERATIGEDRVARATVRFGKSARAEEIYQDVIDGIRTLVSVGYRIHDMVLESRSDAGETYRVTDWEPFEVSIVAVPADPTVGVGRDADEETHIRSLITKAKESKMDENETKDPAPKAAPKVEAVDRDKLIAGERQRARDIAALGEKFNMRELAEQAIEAGTSYDAFRETVFSQLEESGQIRLADPKATEVGLSENEKRNFRVTNLIAAALYPDDPTVRKLAGFELEVARAAADKRPSDNVRKDRVGAFTIPVDILGSPMEMRAWEAEQAVKLLMQRMGVKSGLVGTRDMVVGTPTAGGNLVSTDLLASSFIDMLVNSMVLMSLGTTILPDLVGGIAIPRQTGGTTGYWVAENAGATESAAAFDQVAMTPKTVGAFADYSRRLLLQSSIAVEAFVRMDLARTIALAIDLAGINGSGASNQPRGVLQTSGIGSVAGGTNGAAPTWDNMVDLESAVANANAANGRLAYLTNTKVRGKLKRTQQFAGTNGQAIWQGNEVNGYSAAVSNQVPSNLTKGTSSGICSAIAYGNWADLLIGMWGGLDVMLDPYTGSVAGTKRVVALQDVDVAVRHPESFSAMLDALTT